MQPHEERVVKELAELSEKRDKLEHFFVTALYLAVPDDEKQRMRRQAMIMRLYEQVLQERIEHFPIAEGATIA